MGKKQQIVGLIKSGHDSYREIAKIAGVSAASVSRIAKTLEMPGSADQLSRNNRQNCRRKRKTSERTDRFIVNTALQKRNATTRDILQDVLRSGVTLSERTLRRRFYENKLFCRRPAKKPKLTLGMIQKRLNWARMHSRLTHNYWNKVFFKNLLFQMHFSPVKSTVEINEIFLFLFFHTGNL